MNRREFLSVYKALTPAQRNEVAVCMNIQRPSRPGFPEPFSWNVVALEVKANTKLSKKLLGAIG